MAIQYRNNVSSAVFPKVSPLVAGAVEGCTQQKTITVSISHHILGLVATIEEERANIRKKTKHEHKEAGTHSAGGDPGG